MKQLCFFAFLALFVVSSIAEAAWVTQNARGTPLKKLGRGVVNVVTGVLELPREMFMAGQDGIQQGEFPFTAYPEGMLKGAIPGVVKSAERVGSGVYDIVSFPVEQPLNYGSLYQPATIFESGNWTPPRRVSNP